MIAFAKPDNVLAMPQRPFVRTSFNNEWLTPSRYIEAARKLLGKIDLDPASCEFANKMIKATRFYTDKENGLQQEWGGQVWLNPPYGTTNGQSNQGIWARRLIYEYKSGNVQEAVLLVTAATDMKWFQPLWEYPICFVDHGIYFYRPQSNDDMKHGQGSAFVYLGSNEQRFIEVFSKFGTIAKRVSTPRQTVTPLSLWEE
jgi:ParB family transcriptional regulator, chromosome partitioning protein